MSGLDDHQSGLHALVRSSGTSAVTLTRSPCVPTSMVRSGVTRPPTRSLNGRCSDS